MPKTHGFLLSVFYASQRHALSCEHETHNSGTRARGESELFFEGFGTNGAKLWGQAPDAPAFRLSLQSMTERKDDEAMIELKGITKEYPAGDGAVHALKGVSLQFRDSEFVSILGPSGCGKTTLLNILGGLDHATSGDLLINGHSTKNFRDRDWDAYRNHSVGFVFQSYNLIPHQSVLQNVELALTLSGVSKGERRRRAKEALERVGLGTQLRKRPSEMSGGQMQRVAIARAIVNNPEIILADEPTGALDTETSVQVLEILREIAKDRLVVMVTHNPDLAKTYSTRIIRMLDGEITDDSRPLSEGERSVQAGQAKERIGKKRLPSMSFLTSFGLSLKNLVTKKGRTSLTSFAGSIGIIGIALIFAVSNGMTQYINAVQEETLSSYPITLEAQHRDVGTLMETFLGAAQSAGEHGDDAVYAKGMIYEMLNALNNMETKENDLASFREYLEQERAKAGGESQLRDAVSAVQYTYDLDLLIYTKNVDGTILRSDMQELMRELLLEYLGMDVTSMIDMRDQYGGGSGNSPMSAVMSGGMSAELTQEMLPGDGDALLSPILEKQYDVVYGQWPGAYNEIVLVLDENNEVDDLSLYALGLTPKEEIDDLADAAFHQAKLTNEKKEWTYQEICDMEFRLVLNSDCYAYDEATGTYQDLRITDAGQRYLYDNGMPLKVSGILRPKKDVTAPMLTSPIGYTSALTEHILALAGESDAVQAQQADPETDIFTGLPFDAGTGALTDQEKEEAFRDYVAGLDEAQKAAAYVQMQSIPSQEQIDAAIQQAMGQMGADERKDALMQALSKQMGMDEASVQEYVDAMSDADLDELYAQMITEQTKQQYAAQVEQQLQDMTAGQLAGALDLAMAGYTTAQCAAYYEEILTFSDSTYEENLAKLGCLDLASPASINLYASSFENKDVIEEAIAGYNETVDELSQIHYTDYVGIMMASVTTIIQAITYVLVAFVAISLVVSSIMIGVITLISVQERTKEIGILRAIGASKRNVSSMFNAETVIIGFASGVLGIAITYLLCIPINAILHRVTGIGSLNASLPLSVAGALVVISMLLTLVAGIIPSRSAAKKDPVVALRTE